MLKWEGHLKHCWFTNTLPRERKAGQISGEMNVKFKNLWRWCNPEEKRDNEGLWKLWRELYFFNSLYIFFFFLLSRIMSCTKFFKDVSDPPSPSNCKQIRSTRRLGALVVTVSNSNLGHNRQRKATDPDNVSEDKLHVTCFHIFPFVSSNWNWNQINGINSSKHRRPNHCACPFYYTNPISIRRILKPGEFGADRGGLATFLLTLKLK